jgi:paraquat-inducible protein B
MNTQRKTEFPDAKLKKQATLSLIWLVPILAAIVAGVLVFQNLKKLGPTITVQFENGNGLERNQTLLRYRGVRVGSVRSIQLAKDTRCVEVRAQLDRSASRLAREGTVFWIVRPEVGAAGLRALDTIVSGAYIQVQPGNGNNKPQKNFIGANEAPITRPPGGGVEFVLSSPGVSSLAQGSPVYYRGVEVGSVQYIDLSKDSTSVGIHVLIKTNFAPLVHTNTVWWNAGGINVDLHFFGINMNAENFKSLIIGAIAFATPTESAELAKTGMIFPLYEKADAKWLEWSPQIGIVSPNAVPPDENSSSINLNNANVNQLQNQ